LRAEGFSCSLDILYEGLGISKLQFLIKKRYTKFSAVFFFVFWSSIPWIRIHFKCRIRIRMRIQCDRIHNTGRKGTARHVFRNFSTSLIKLYSVCSVCFLLATEALYDLSRKYLKDEYLAYKGRKTTSQSAKILSMIGQVCSILRRK
jgi:hypothetical protein